MTRRTERVNDLLQEELSELLRGLNDPRLAGQGLLSITDVTVAPDLRHAIVYISYLGTDEQRESALQGLKAAAHYLQRELMTRLHMRHVPDLAFRFDPSIERGARLSALISEVNDGGAEPA
jgi:ribosome-binding factor A